MAGASAAPGLDQAAICALMEATPLSGPLPGVFLVLANKEDGTGHRVLGHLVRVRTGGFMVALPEISEASEFLQTLETLEGADDMVAFYSAEVEMETMRGRALGQGPCLLADVMWEFAHHFKRATPLRSVLIDVKKFAYEGNPCRPRRASVLAASEQWIHEYMDDDTAGDYVTGEEALPEEELVPPEAMTAEDEVTLLRERLRVLEAAVLQPKVSKASQPSAALALTPPRPKGVLFGAQQTTPSQAPPPDALEKLRSLAGVAPLRLGAHEKKVREHRPEQVLEALQQEATLEAVEPGELEEGLEELQGAVQDPMQRMLLLQMKQLQLLSRQQNNARASDPLTAALSGSDGQSTGSGGSVKGCAAREAYLRLLQDHSKIAWTVLENACTELGYDVHQAYPGYG